MFQSFRKVSALLFFVGILSFSMVSTSFAASDAENSVTGFLKRLFHYPVNATQETAGMTANTLQNAGEKVIEILFWEYRFFDPLNPKIVARRQFLCGVNIKPAKNQELQAFSVSGPSGVISAQNAGTKSENAFQEKVVINRVEYADGTIWQRKDWNFGEIGMSYRRAVNTPWGTEMCRGL